MREGGRDRGEREREREKEGDKIGLGESKTYHGKACIEFNSSVLGEIFEIGRSQNSPTILVYTFESC
jgi:hypothetical protein